MTYKMFIYRVAVLAVLIVTGFFMVGNSKFNKLPYPLFGWALLVEAVQYYSMIAQQLYYTTGLYRFTIPPLRAPILPELEPGQVSGALLKSNVLSFELAVYTFRTMRSLISNLELIMNSIIIIDLYYTLRNPFRRRESRLKYYNVFIVCVLVALTSYYVVHYSKYPGSGLMVSIEPSIADTSRYEYYGRIALLAYACFCFFRVLVRLCVPGTSKTLRRRVAWRFILYFIVFLIRFLPPVLLVKD